MKNYLAFAALMFGMFVPATAAQAQKIGALAIDKRNGFAYGFAFDHDTRAQAEARALEEVANRGGNGSVVLVWSGEGCGAYRTIDPKDGSAYGWGVAATQIAAEAIADREVAKRSNGKPAQNHTWACNSKSPQKMKVLKDATNENFRTVRIGSQLWTADNLAIDRFRNGDPIPKIGDFLAFHKLSTQKKPASYCYASDPTCSKFGRFYNLWAVIDPRGFVPEGWRVPSAGDFETLFSGLGGKEAAVARLRSTTGWPEWADPITGSSGFDALSTGHPATSKPSFNGAYFWTTSSVDDGKVWRNHAFLSAYDTADEARIGTQDGNEPLNVRLIAE